MWWCYHNSVSWGQLIMHTCILNLFHLTAIFFAVVVPLRITAWSFCLSTQIDGQKEQYQLYAEYCSGNSNAHISTCYQILPHLCITTLSITDCRVVIGTRSISNIKRESLSTLRIPELASHLTWFAVGLKLTTTYWEGGVNIIRRVVNSTAFKLKCESYMCMVWPRTKITEIPWQVRKWYVYGMILNSPTACSLEYYQTSVPIRWGNLYSGSPFISM